MNYFLGFIPDENTNYKIRGVLGEVGRIFEGQGIPVRWSKPENFHITLLYLGDSLNFIQKFLLTKKLENFKFKSFKISFEKVNLGISRSYKELVYLSVFDGGDELRELFYNLNQIYRIEDPSKFIPHLSIGRVNADLSNEGEKNIVTDLSTFNHENDLSEISFHTKKLSLIESDGSTYKVLASFEANQ